MHGKNEGSGLAAIVDASYDTGEVGDVLIVGYGEEELYHAVMITDVVTDEDGNVIDYLVCSNTANQKNYPISAYGYTYQVLIKILRKQLTKGDRLHIYPLLYSWLFF